MPSIHPRSRAPATFTIASSSPESQHVPIWPTVGRAASMFCMLAMRPLFASPTPGVLGLTGQHLGGSDGTLLRERKVRSRAPAASNPRDCAQIALHAFVLTLVFACFGCTGAREVLGWGVGGRSLTRRVRVDRRATAAAVGDALGPRHGRRQRLFFACLCMSVVARSRACARGWL